MARAALVALCLFAACKSGSSAPVASAEPTSSTVLEAAASADAATVDDVAPVESSASCAPPVFEQKDPAPAAHTLEGMVELLRNPDCTIHHVERDFGKWTPSTSHSDSYEFAAPVGDVARLIVGYTRVQNREYLERATIDFPEKTRPTVGKLAARLGLSSQVGKRPVHNSCTDGYCPVLDFDYKGVARAFSFYLADSPRPALGSQNVAQLPVRELFFFTHEGRCTTGMAASEPTAMPDPAPGRAHDLADAMRAAAREFVKEKYDPTHIEHLLGAFGRVKVEHNELSDFSWVRVLPEKSQSLAAFCFPGFRYVKDRDLVCHIAQNHRHLYETDGTATHRLFLTVELDRENRINLIELTLMPKNWHDIVF